MSDVSSGASWYEAVMRFSARDQAARPVGDAATSFPVGAYSIYYEDHYGMRFSTPWRMKKMCLPTRRRGMRPLYIVHIKDLKNV